MPKQTVPPYTLIRSRRKTVALVVQPDGALIVRAPLHLSSQEIQAMVAAKAAWIAQKQQEAAEHPSQRRPARHFAQGDVYLYLGQAYPLRLVSQGKARLTLQDGVFQLREDAQGQARAIFEAWYQAQARQVFAARVAHFSTLSGLQPSQVRLSSARTRWGSCSARGVVSLTWRLVLAPLEIIDYVVAHELTHLVVPNHSTRFWSALAQLFPAYPQARAWLRHNGHQLTVD